MSQIIDEGSFDCVHTQINLQPSLKNQLIINLKSFFQESFTNTKFQNFQYDSSWKMKGSTLIHQISLFLDLYLQIQFSDIQFQIKGKILYHNKLLPVFSKQNRKFFAKQVCKKKFSQLFQSLHLLLDLNNGDWFIKTPIINCIELNIKQFKKIFSREIQNFVAKSIKVFQLIKKLQNQREDQLSQIKRIKIFQILRYYNRCTVQPSISIKSDCAQYQSVMNRYAASRCGLEDLIKYNNHSQKVNQVFFSTLKIFGYNILTDSKVKYLDQISLKQKQKIQEEINIPSFILSRPKENKFIFNHCYFLKDRYDQKKIAEGSNSQIFVFKPEIYEYSSSNSQDQNCLEKSQIISKYISKHLVFKKNKLPEAIKSQKQACLKIKQLIGRQTKIVSLLRGGSCLFLPKYYLNIQKNSNYNNQLFMDYLPGQTLDQFLSQHQCTVSIFTKMYLVLQILQGLRFISQYGISHLDIKQKNIIVMKKLICKIFDFQESYHYKVCGTHHKPKYTMLYASPQVVTSIKGRVFTQKSDTFSFGIMLYKIFFNKYPYLFTSHEKFSQINFQNALRSKTFYCPQEIQEYGYPKIFPILHQLVLKCIDCDQTKRPFLDWTTLVLKCFLNYITFTQ